MSVYDDNARTCMHAVNEKVILMMGMVFYCVYYLCLIVCLWQSCQLQRVQGFRSPHLSFPYPTRDH